MGEVPGVPVPLVEPERDIFIGEGVREDGTPVRLLGTGGGNSSGPALLPSTV
jgi:hypothetical protein